MKVTKRNIIIHLGISGFPGITAPLQRVLLTFKALKIAGYIPIVINKFSLNYTHGFKRVSVFEGIPFINTSINLNRPDSIFFRTLNKISGFCLEYFLLFRKRKYIKVAVLYSPSMLELLYYRLVSNSLNIKIIIQYVELRSAINVKRWRVSQLNDFLFDRYCHTLCDGVIAISTYLKHHVESRDSRTPVLKLPAIADFEAFGKVSSFSRANPYIMYCGSIDYLEVITFVIELFHEIRIDRFAGSKLLLVISGKSAKNWQALRTIIEKSSLCDFITIQSNISSNRLLSYYLGAELLIIPLRNTKQDIARFPHKIGEYSASKRPILSTNVGEVKHYFANYKSALLANEYTVDSYKSCVSQFFASGRSLEAVGEEGYEIGFKNFDYRSQAMLLVEFIENIKI